MWPFKDFYSRLKKYIRINIVRKLHKDGLEDTKFLLADIPIRCIFDVGANVGDMTAEYVNIFKTAEIYCFEPHPEAFSFLQNRFQHNPKIHLFNLAISDQVGQSPFFITPLSRTSSLYAPISGTSTEINVDIATLDSFGIETIDILKIDIEGAEIQALEGAHHLLSQGAIRLIYAESRMIRETEGGTLTHHIASFLEKYGYSFHNIYDIVESAARGIIYADAIFLSPQLREALATRLGSRSFTKRF